MSLTKIIPGGGGGGGGAGDEWAGGGGGLARAVVGRGEGPALQAAGGGSVAWGVHWPCCGAADGSASAGGMRGACGGPLR